jgi:hypothetical protein
MSEAQRNEYQVDRLVMPNYRLLCDNFTEIIIYQLHSFEQADKTGEVQFAGLEVMKEEAIKRYQNDYIFHAKVESTVALLMRATQEERDNRVAGLPFERFRIVEA